MNYNGITRILSTTLKTQMLITFCLVEWPYIITAPNGHPMSISTWTPLVPLFLIFSLSPTSSTNVNHFFSQFFNQFSWSRVTKQLMQNINSRLKYLNSCQFYCVLSTLTWTECFPNIVFLILFTVLSFVFGAFTFVAFAYAASTRAALVLERFE